MFSFQRVFIHVLCKCNEVWKGFWICWLGWLGLVWVYCFGVCFSFGWMFLWVEFFCFAFPLIPVVYFIINLENSWIKCLSSVCSFHYQGYFWSRCLTLLLFDVELWCKVFEKSLEYSTKAGNKCHRSLVFHFEVLPHNFWLLNHIIPSKL